MTPSLTRTRELLGSQCAVSLPVYAVLVVFLAVGTIGFQAGENWSVDVILAAWVAQCIFDGIVMLGIRWLVIRRRPSAPLPLAIVLALGGWIGVTRSVCLVVVPVLFGGVVPATNEGAPLLFFSFVVAPALYLAMVYFVASRDAYTTERVRLVALDVRRSEERLRAAGALDAMLDETLTTIEARLQQARASTAQLLAEEQPDPTAIAASLLAAARTGMRPLSHELWRSTGTPIPPVRWRHYIGIELRRNPLPILAPTVGFCLLFVIGAIARLGFANCAVALVVAVVSIHVCFRCGRAIVRRSQALALPITGVAIVCASLPVMIAAQAVGAASGRVPLVIALLFSTVMLTTVAAALRDARDEVVLDLAQQINVKELEQLAMQEARDRLRREVAEYLHGSMQTDLISASLAMQEAVHTRSEIDLRVATDAAIAALSVQYDPHRTVSGQSMVELMANAERRWNGVLGVAWEIEAESIPLAVVPTIASLITEALTNAVVHGAASHATIGIVQSDEHLELRVIDDGIGPQGGVPGLGSALFDDATARHWTIEPGLMGGATMRAVLPI